MEDLWKILGKFRVRFASKSPDILLRNCEAISVSAGCVFFSDVYFPTFNSENLVYDAAVLTGHISVS